MNNFKKILGYYYSHLKKYKLYFYGSEITLFIGSILINNSPPLIIAIVLNKLVSGNYDHKHAFTSFIPYILVYAVLTIFIARLIWYLFDYFYWRLEGKVISSISNQIFSYLLEQSADFHANQFSGTLSSNSYKVAASYVSIADTLNFAVLQMFATIIFVNFVMVGRSFVYTILLDLVAVFYILISIYVTRPLRKANEVHSKLVGEQTGLLSDVLSNILTVKSYARSSFEKARYKKHADKVTKQLMVVFRKFSYQQNIFGGVIGVLEVGALVSAVISVLYFKSNIATAFLIFNYTSMIIMQLYNFSNHALRSLNRSFADASVMINQLDVKPEVLDPVEPEKVKINNGEVYISNINFTHEGNSKILFKNFSLKIEDGQKVGLVGHSGAGKTSLIKLLMRFSNVDNGEINIDNQNIASITQDDLHEKISYVPQEPLLFHRTIRENIIYGNPNASEKEIERVVKDAHVDFVDQLPSGLDTLVGERGVKLSGGQRQRVAIARAMLKKAPVIILDEATSALDSKSEVLIQDALWKLMQGRTTIVIAHRLSTIMEMDRIIVLDKGRIVEDGSHKELLSKDGFYADLWEHQSGGFIED